jgi:hypothetical protein
MLVVVGLNLGRYMVCPFYVLELLRFFRVVRVELLKLIES